jgi:hypothetical protein
MREELIMERDAHKRRKEEVGRTHVNFRGRDE